MCENGYPDRSQLPTSPGVYIFKDAKDGVIYVGKAKNVRSRVANYFTRSGDGRPKIAELRERVSQIDFIVTESETEALVLEANLIKRHRPRFNASLKDDKSYPYVVVTTGDEYPRVFATRSLHDPRHRYFGPFPSAGSVRSTIDVLNKTFPFRKCRGSEPGRRSGVPCLNYHIGRSVAPCIGAVSKEEYDKIVADVIAFLEGRVNHLIRERETAMREAAREMDFERAAALRDPLAAHLSELRGTRVEVRRPQRGDKRRILEMAEKNAKLGLDHEKALEEAQRNRVASTLDALREELALPKLPVRIECYDISNTMGTNSVASMVVFQGGR